MKTQYTQKSLKQRLLSGGIWAFSAKVGTGFITIALTALVTRLLDPESVGVLFLSFSIIIMVSIMTRLGLDQLGIKLIGEALAKEKYKIARHITFRIMKIIVAFSILCAIFIYFLFDSFIGYFLSAREADQLFQLLFVLWVIVTPVQLLFAEIFRAYHHISFASIFSGGTLFGGFGVSLVTGIMLIILYFIGLTLTLNIILVIIMLVTCAFLVIELFQIFKISRIPMGYINENGKSKANIEYTRLIKKGFPFFITMLSVFSLIHMDTIILGYYQSEEEVAIYAASTRIVKLLIISLIVAYEVVAPVIVELNAKNELDELQNILRLVATLAAIPSTVVLVLFIFRADYILEFLYGEYYKEGAIILTTLSIGQLINVWTGLSGYTLNMLGYQKINMYISSFVTVVALILCVFFAKQYGSLGVAVIISTAWAVQNIATVLLAKYYTDIWTHAGLGVAFSGLASIIKYNKLRKDG